MRYQKHRTDRKNIRRRVMALLAAGIAVFAAVNYKVNPILKKMTAVQAAYIANFAIDRAAANVLAEEDISYSDLIRSPKPFSKICWITATGRLPFRSAH